MEEILSDNTDNLTDEGSLDGKLIERGNCCFNLKDTVAFLLEKMYLEKGLL
jgi:hypothetical protein